MMVGKQVTKHMWPEASVQKNSVFHRSKSPHEIGLQRCFIGILGWKTRAGRSFQLLREARVPLTQFICFCKCLENEEVINSW